MARRGAQVREAQLAQYNYILVVGEAERNAKTVNVRTRDNVVHGMFALEDVTKLLVEVRASGAEGRVGGVCTRWKGGRGAAFGRQGSGGSGSEWGCRVKGQGEPHKA